LQIYAIVFVLAMIVLGTIKRFDPDFALSTELSSGYAAWVTFVYVAFVLLLPGIVLGLMMFVLCRQLFRWLTGERLSLWAKQRGFTPIDGSWLDDLPLDLAISGHTIRTKRSFRGRLCDVETVVGGYQWTQGRGRSTRSGFVGLIVLKLPPSVAARFFKTVVRDAGAINTGRTIGGMRELRFESTELDRVLQVLVPDSQDEIACFELFNPPFLELLARRPDARYEQSQQWLALPFHGVLTPFSDDPIVDSDEIDGDCSLALRIYDRYLEEWQ
jgi:hypothetical protein